MQLGTLVAYVEKQWAHLFLQFDYFSLSVVQGLVTDLDVPSLVLVGGAQRVKLDLEFLLFPLGLFVYGATKQWKESGLIRVSVYRKQTVELIAFGEPQDGYEARYSRVCFFFLRLGGNFWKGYSLWTRSWEMVLRLSSVPSHSLAASCLLAVSIRSRIARRTIVVMEKKPRRVTQKTLQRYFIAYSLRCMWETNTFNTFTTVLSVGHSVEFQTSTNVGGGGIRFQSWNELYKAFLCENGDFKSVSYSL